MTERLQDGCTQLGLSLSQNQLEKLDSYADLVLDCNKTYNLMKADTKDSLCVHHLLDSLAAVPHIKELSARLEKTFSTTPLHYADIGSGGGCPGIPLSIAFPEIQFTLVERMEKRCTFLERCVHTLSLSNVQVLCTQVSRIEENRFHLLAFRAFHPFDTKTATSLLRITKPEGYIVAYKARLEKITQEMEAVKKEIPEYTKISLTVPFLEDHERHLVVIKAR